MFEDVGMMWCSAEKKRALVCRWFLARERRKEHRRPSRRVCMDVFYATIEKKKNKNVLFFFLKKKKKKELKNVRIWTMRFHSKRSASNNNNKSPNDAAIGLVRSRRFV